MVNQKLMNPSNVTRVLAFLLAGASTLPLSAQERLEIDVEAGRVIIDGFEYDFTRVAAVDHERRIVYVVDAVEPLGVMALSIEDGSRIAIYGGSRGDGPGELRSLTSVSLSPEGVLVSGGGVINHWGREGNLIGAWRPGLSDASRVPGQCMVNGRLVVPSLTGAIWRRPDGSWELLGRRPGGNVGTDIFGATRLACIDDVAYVLDERLAGYSPDGSVTRLSLPEEVEEASRSWRENLRGGAVGHPYSALFDDGTGQLVVVVPRYARGEVLGATIDPATGCYAIITSPDPVTRRTHALIGMHRDSAVVAESEVEEQVVNGVRTPVLYPGARRIALRPLRPAGGTPCPDKVGQ